MILGQPYITITRMEINVLDEDSYYVRVHSHDDKRSMQFLIIMLNHEKYRNQLRRTFMNYEHDDFLIF